MTKLKYLTTRVVFQEVPNEVSLAINVSGCPYRCRGCHSPELQEDRGEILLENLPRLLKTRGITCVCFMGGIQNLEDLGLAAAMVKENNLKVAIYSGSEEEEINQQLFNLKPDFLKIGSYQEEFGALGSKTTNQKFYHLIYNEDGSTAIENWNHKFLKDLTF